MRLNRNVKLILFVFIFLILIDGSLSAMNVLSSLSYSTGYQGARAQFTGINYKGTIYTPFETHDASKARFDTTLSFDPDDPNRDQCNLEGEMTSVFIPSESLSNFPSWIPTEWQRKIAYISNPRNVYEWETENKSYRMEEWILRWYFSISAEWDQLPPWSVGTSEWHNQRYQNTEIWFELDLTPVWYFEGAERAYFAIAKLQIAEVRLKAKTPDGQDVEPEKFVSVKPESTGSILPVYYAEFAKSNDATKTPMTYQGRKLNPDLFTSKVYTYFTLENFGTTSWVELSLPPEYRYKGDVVTVAVDVYVFVIGEWDVKDVQSIERVEGEEGYGRTAKIGGAGFSLGDWLRQPENRFLLVLLGALGVFLLLAIFAPWVLIIIFSLFGSGRRNKS